MSPSSKKIGRYEVLDTLGQGGMGIVYLAYDPVLGRKVAVKMILASNFATEDQDDLLRRLLKEGQAAANMRHPGIVTVFDAMQQGDETYIVMEYVAGLKLSDLLKERPEHETALRVLREIGPGARLRARPRHQSIGTLSLTIYCWIPPATFASPTSGSPRA